MSVKSLVEEKFVALCRGISACPDVWIAERTKAGTSFSFDGDDGLSMTIFVDWDKLINLISDNAKLDLFLRVNLRDEEDEEDPFTSGELVFDSDGRVHFARDLE